MPFFARVGCAFVGADRCVHLRYDQRMGPVDNLSRCVVCGLRWVRTLPSLTASRGPIPPRPATSQHCARSVATSATARSMRPSRSFGFAEFTAVAAVPSAQCLRRFGQALPCSYAECAGHCGHICLSVPVFQPLLFDTLFKVSSPPIYRISFNVARVPRAQTCRWV